MRGRLACLAVLLCAWNHGASAQTVSGVTGTLTHGSSMTIAGSDFGTKTTAAPVKYDDFQSVTTGQPIDSGSPGGPAWTGGGTIEPIASADLLRSGTPYAKNMLSRWEPTGGASPDASNVNFTHDFTYLYLDAWFYHDTSGETSGSVNVKPWRIHTDNGGNPNSSGVVWVSGIGGDVVNCASDGDVPDDGVSDFFPGVTASDLADGWVHLQQWLYYGSGNGTVDGTCITRLTGATTATETLSGTFNPGRTGFTAWTDFWIGNYVRSEDWSGTARFFWEAVYVDDTWARVELSDNATYTSASHREIQIPSAWSSTSVSATINRGSFAADASVYVHVCTAANACSAGYAVTLGGEASPSAPVRLRIRVADFGWLTLGLVPLAWRRLRIRGGDAAP